MKGNQSDAAQNVLLTMCLPHPGCVYELTVYSHFMMLLRSLDYMQVNTFESLLIAVRARGKRSSVIPRGVSLCMSNQYATMTDHDKK